MYTSARAAAVLTASLLLPPAPRSPLALTSWRWQAAAEPCRPLRCKTCWPTSSKQRSRTHRRRCGELQGRGLCVLPPASWRGVLLVRPTERQACRNTPHPASHIAVLYLINAADTRLPPNAACGGGGRAWAARGPHRCCSELARSCGTSGTTTGAYFSKDKRRLQAC